MDGTRQILHFWTLDNRGQIKDYIDWNVTRTKTLVWKRYRIMMILNHRTFANIGKLKNILSSREIGGIMKILCWTLDNSYERMIILSSVLLKY